MPKDDVSENSKKLDNASIYFSKRQGRC